MGEFFSGNNERWESHERRGHMWGDVVPQEQSVLKPEMGPAPQKPRRKLVYRNKKKPVKKKTKDPTPDDAFKELMDLSKDEDAFLACLNKWLDEPRFEDKETPGRNLLVGKGDWHASTLLHFAVFHDDVGTVAKLLAKGADPNQMNSEGDSPIMDAEEFEHDEVLELMRAEVKRQAPPEPEPELTKAQREAELARKHKISSNKLHEPNKKSAYETMEDRKAEMRKSKGAVRSVGVNACFLFRAPRVPVRRNSPRAPQAAARASWSGRSSAPRSSASTRKTSTTSASSTRGRGGAQRTPWYGPPCFNGAPEVRAVVVATLLSNI